MTLASTGISVASASGGVIAAAHSALANSSRLCQVVMLADPSGHLAGTVPTYTLWAPLQLISASRLYLDFYNSNTSGSDVAIRGIWAVPKQDVGVTTGVNPEFQLYKTGSVGTGGSAVTYQGSSLASGLIVPMDSTNSAINAAITARILPTGGASISGAYWTSFIPVAMISGIDNTPTALIPYFNQLPQAPMIQNMTLHTAQGILIKGGTTSVAGSPQVGFLLSFTVVSAA